MDNFSFTNSFEHPFFWAKPSCSNHLPSFGCPSTCTTLSQTSQPSPSGFDLESEENDFFRFPINSPIKEREYDDDDEDSLPEDSACAHDGSFDGRLNETFDDFGLNGFEDGGFYSEEGEFLQGNSLRQQERNRQRQTKTLKERKMFKEAWEMFKNIFMKYLASSTAVNIMKDEMNREQMLWKTGLKQLYRLLKREGKKMLKKNIVQFPQETASSDEYERLVWELLRKLYYNFLNEKAEYAIEGLKNINHSTKELMLEMLVTIGR